MSGHEVELQRVAHGSTERGKARRFLVGFTLLWSALGVAPWLSGSTIPSAFHLLNLVMMFLGLVLALSAWPNASGALGRPRNLRRVARTAGLPEVGTVVVLYLFAVAGFTSTVVALIALYDVPMALRGI